MFGINQEEMQTSKSSESGSLEEKTPGLVALFKKHSGGMDLNEYKK